MNCSQDKAQTLQHGLSAVIWRLPNLSSLIHPYRPLWFLRSATVPPDLDQGSLCGKCSCPTPSPISSLHRSQFKGHSQLLKPQTGSPVRMWYIFLYLLPYPRMSLQRNEGSNRLPPRPPSMVSTWYVRCQGRSSASRGLGEKGESVTRRSRTGHLAPPEPWLGPPHSPL